MRLTMPQAQTPLGAAVQNIAQAFLSGPSPLEREDRRLKHGLIGAQTDKYRGEATKLGRQNAGANTLADLFKNLPTTADSDPGTMANLGAAALRGDIDPKNLAEAMRFYQANRNAPQQIISNSMLGAGDAMSSTPTGFGIDQKNKISMNAADNARAMAQTRYTTDNAEAQYIDPVTKQPVLGPRAKAFGNSPILKDTEVQTVPNPAGGYMTALNTPGAPTVPPGSGTSTPRNYMDPTGKQGVTLDGVTDAATGQRIPGGSQVYTGQVQATGINGVAPTAAAKTELWRENKSLKQFQDTLKIANDLAQNNPTAFGAAGSMRRTWQSAMAQGDAMAQALGFQANAIKDFAAQSGMPLDPNVFDPSLPQIDVMMRILPYQAAAAIAQQEGRGLSNVDVQAFRNVVGEGPLASLEDFMARKNLLEQMVTQRLGVNERMQGNPNANVPPVVTAPPPTTGPAAAPQIFDKPTKRIDLQGNEIVR